MNRAELAELNIHVDLDSDGLLCVNAPKGALTPAVIAQIREAKPALVAELNRKRERGEPDFPWSDPGSTVSASGTGALTPQDESILLGWLTRIGERDPVAIQEVMDACRVDSEVLAGFLWSATKARPGASEDAGVPPATQPLPPRPKGCGSRLNPACRHFTAPGLSSGYCKSGREDLEPAYGPMHPLRKLPDDNGESCSAYASRDEPVLT